MRNTSNQIETLISSLKKYEAAHAELVGAWYDASNDSVNAQLTRLYPFDTSFDDLHILVRAWVENSVNAFTDSMVFDILSPDGFPIHPTDTYTGIQAVNAAIADWCKRFEQQGYYSTIQNGERVQIPLNELPDHLVIRPAFDPVEPIAESDVEEGWKTYNAVTDEKKIWDLISEEGYYDAMNVHTDGNQDTVTHILISDVNHFWIAKHTSGKYSTSTDNSAEIYGTLAQCLELLRFEFGISVI